MSNRCDKHPAQRKYSGYFDAYFCQLCDEWLEGKCELTADDCYCNCAKRPNKPSEIMKEVLKPLHIFEFYEDLPEEVNRSMSDQGVCMDDWDYLLFFPFLGKSALMPRGWCNTDISPDNYNIDKMLHGCYKNVWKYVDDFGGRSGVVGVAYHS